MTVGAPLIGFVCPLCLCKYPIAECRLLKCHHGFCQACIRRWLEINGSATARKPLSCPKCRKPAQKDDLTGLFLDTVIIDEDSVSQPSGVASSHTQASLSANISNHVAFVAKGLGQLGPRSEPSSVLRAGKEIEKVVNAVTTGVPTTILRDRVLDYLVQAVDDFKQRIGPTFEEVAAQQERLIALQKQVDDATAEIGRLKFENSVCQNNREEALQLGEDLAARLKENHATFSQRIGDQEREIRHLQNECSSRDAKIRLLMETCKKKDKEIPRHLSQFSSDFLSTSSMEGSSLSQDPEANDSDTFALTSSEEETDPYPTPTSPSIRAKLQQDGRLSARNWKTVESRPKFVTDWNLERPSNTKKRKASSGELAGFPVKLDEKGRPKGPVLLGTRQRFGKRF